MIRGQSGAFGAKPHAGGGPCLCRAQVTFLKECGQPNAVQDHPDEDCGAKKCKRCGHSCRPLDILGWCKPWCPS